MSRGVFVGSVEVSFTSTHWLFDCRVLLLVAPTFFSNGRELLQCVQLGEMLSIPPHLYSTLPLNSSGCVIQAWVLDSLHYISCTLPKHTTIITFSGVATAGCFAVFLPLLVVDSYHLILCRCIGGDACPLVNVTNHLHFCYRSPLELVAQPRLNSH